MHHGVSKANIMKVARMYFSCPVFISTYAVVTLLNIEQFCSRTKNSFYCDVSSV